MRLLNTNTLGLEVFVGDVPSYAILSHTWLANEATFEEIKSSRSRAAFDKATVQHDDLFPSYAKIRHSAEFARAHGFDYIWIDTCCIDQSSSAELSEAINSMFAWYRNAEICYAYLADVHDAGSSGASRMASLSQSRWFTRGWTLQELIAPKEVVFLSSQWRVIGTRKDLVAEIVRITKITRKVLQPTSSLENIAAGAKMSWISRRNTTRPEDIAYCLLGIFNVNMPLLYGEGKEKAFMRLQEEYLKVSDDESIFAWRTSKEEAQTKPYWGLLAPSPKYFENSSGLEKSMWLSLRDGHPTMVTNHGLRVELSLSPLQLDESGTIFIAVLNCYDISRGLNPQSTIFLQRLSNQGEQYARVAVNHLLGVSIGILLLPPDIFTDSFRRANVSKPLKEIVDSKTKYIFIKPASMVSVIVAGFYFEPSNVQFSTPAGPVQKFTLSVAKYKDPFVSSGEGMASAWYSHNLKRWYAYCDSDIFEPGHLKERKVFGGLIGITVTSNGSTSLQNWSKTAYFLAGLEPLPENPFGTPAGFVRPWYTFLPDVSHSASQTLSRIDLPGGFQLMINFSFETCWATVFHKINFCVANASDNISL